MRVSLKSDITLMAVSYIHILGNMISLPKTGQSCFSIEKV